MTWSPTTRRPPGPPLALAIALLIAGVLAAIVSFGSLGSAMLHSVSNASTLSAPGSEAVVCHSGTYLLYTESGSNVLNPSAVAVTGPNGAAVAVEVEIASESVSRFGTRYSGLLGFTATRNGTYTVTVSASGVTLVVAPSLANTAEKNVGLLLVVGVSLLTALVGVILLIVALVQRSGVRKDATGYAGGQWGAGQGRGWPALPAPPGGPGGYGWTGTPRPPQTGPAGWSPPPGWPPPPGAADPTREPSAPWGPPATPPPPAEPGWSGRSNHPPAAPDGSGQSQGQASGWPRPST